MSCPHKYCATCLNKKDLTMSDKTREFVINKITITLDSEEYRRVSKRVWFAVDTYPSIRFFTNIGSQSAPLYEALEHFIMAAPYTRAVEFVNVADFLNLSKSNLRLTK
jgi:hypothetical protein